MSEDRIEHNEEYIRAVEQSDGFDLEGITQPPDTLSTGNMRAVNLPPLGRSRPYRPLADFYARFGLHHFNMKEGTKWELDYVIKYNMMTPSLASNYFITLAARGLDSVTSRGTQVFQVRVDEKRFEHLHAVCTIARVKGNRDVPSYESFLPPLAVADKDRSFDWPPDDVLERLYLVEGSELPDNHWIRLYLELAVCQSDTYFSDLSKLVIVKAAIETAEEETPLNARNLILYIVFKGVVIRGVAEHVELKAVIKTDFNERTGFLSIKGVVCGGAEDSPPLTPEEKRRFFSAQPVRCSQTSMYHG